MTLSSVLVSGETKPSQQWMRFGSRSFSHRAALSAITPAMLIPLLLSGALLAPAPSCSTPPIAPPAGEPVHVPIEVSNNHVYVTVCVGDRPLSFILDTGAGQSYFDIGFARASGVKIGNGFRARGAGAGSVEGARIEGGAVRVAGTDISEGVPVALDLSALVPREGHALDGILGHDFIERYVIVIDYGAGELRLYDRRSNTDGSSGPSIPLTFSSNQPQVDAEFRLADGGVVRGKFLIDVGSGAALSLAKPVVEANHLRDRIGPTVHKPVGGGVGGRTSGDVGRVASLRIAGVELTAPITTLFGDSAGVFTVNRDGWIGVIGGEILRRFTVTLDFQGKRMMLEPNADFSEPFETDMSGLTVSVVTDPTRPVVEFVQPRSPASEAGLMAGDSVVAINGQPVTSSNLLGWRKVMQREGERMTVTIRRGGETKTVQFTTRRIL